MVLFLYGYCRVIDLYSLEISMDTFFLHLIVHCLCNNQSAEAGDTWPVAYAGFAKYLVYVTVYMFSYSVLGCAFIIALCGLVHHKEEYLVTADNLVYSGVAFLSIGMLLGSLWAKEAWGNYWSWDPKETWAVVTWMGYLLYIHLRLRRKFRKRMLYVILIFSFLALQMCWYGVNYLPSAQQSVHLYNRNN